MENKKVLQRDLDKKIRLDYKTKSNKNFPNLMDKCNKYRENNYRIKSIAKTDWTKIICTNLEWQDRLDCDSTLLKTV